MIKLRKLLEKDAENMLEWMHYEENKQIFQNDFMSKTKEDVLGFINNSYNEISKNFAVINDDDEYLGTISLKNIDQTNHNAEYAISMRKKARGTGAASEATKLILDFAFDELKLHKVYLCVLNTNLRAKKFYEKIGFQYEGTAIDHLFHNGKYKNLLWYSILEDVYKDDK